MGRTMAGSNEFGKDLQNYVQNQFNSKCIPLRQCAGSGNQHRSDSDLTNRLLQVECKGRVEPHNLALPRKSDWRKLVGEAQGSNRFPLLVTCGKRNPDGGSVLCTMRLDHLLYLLGDTNASGSEY